MPTDCPGAGITNSKMKRSTYFVKTGLLNLQKSWCGEVNSMGEFFLNIQRKSVGLYTRKDISIPRINGSVNIPLILRLLL